MEATIPRKAGGVYKSFFVLNHLTLALMHLLSFLVHGIFSGVVVTRTGLWLRVIYNE